MNDKKLEKLRGLDPEEVKKIWNDEESKTNEKLILSNVNLVLINALSFSVALGMNDLIISIFKTFPGRNRNHIIEKLIYVLVMFVITIFMAFWLFKLKQKIKVPS